jgi:Ras-related C3 botulinum toxin substrate 1
MLKAYAEDKFPVKYVPTVFENYNANLMYRDKTVTLVLWVCKFFFFLVYQILFK